MKRKTLFFLPLLLLILALSPFSAMAAETSGQCGENLYWSLSADKTTLTISGTGEMWNYYSYSHPAPWVEALSEAPSPVRLIIQSGVTSIGDYAFADCFLDSQVTLPSSLTDIGNSSFAYARFSSIVIPEGVKHIGGSAFFRSPGLNYVSLPSTLESISPRAFWNCPLEDGIDYNGSKLQWISDVVIDDYFHETPTFLSSLHFTTEADASDWVLENGDWCLYQNGSPYTGWKQMSSRWYYLEDGLIVKESVIKDGGKSYFLDFAGVWDNTPGLHEYYYSSPAYIFSRYVLIDGNGNIVNEEGWKYVGGKWYYVLTDDAGDGYIPANYAYIKVIDGSAYLFDASWISAPGWTHFSENHYMYEHYTLVGDDGRLISGWHKENGSWYYVSPESYLTVHDGLYTIDGRIYYFDFDGIMQTGIQVIDGITYDFGSNGALKVSSTGFQQINGAWYYFNADGSLKSGWVQENGKWYYLDKSTYQMLTEADMYDDWGNFFGFPVIDGKAYCFDENGVMMSDFWYDGDTYFDSTGALASGWKQINGKWYYFDSEYEGEDSFLPVMVTDWQNIGGKWYYFGSDGAMKTGWKSIGGSWYYLGSDGAMKTGWQMISGSWYYLGSDGAMKTGWQMISGSWYYLGSDGAMVTGWKQISGTWYYFKANGAWES